MRSPQLLPLRVSTLPVVTVAGKTSFRSLQNQCSELKTQSCEMYFPTQYFPTQRQHHSVWKKKQKLGERAVLKKKKRYSAKRKLQEHANGYFFVLPCSIFFELVQRFAFNVRPLRQHICKTYNCGVCNVVANNTSRLMIYFGGEGGWKNDNLIQKSFWSQKIYYFFVCHKFCRRDVHHNHERTVWPSTRTRASTVFAPCFGVTTTNWSAVEHLIVQPPPVRQTITLKCCWGAAERKQTPKKIQVHAEEHDESNVLVS